MLLQRSSLKSSLNWLRALLLTAIFVSLSAGAQAQVPIIENHTFKANSAGSPDTDITLLKPLGSSVGDLFLVFVSSDHDNGPEWDLHPTPQLWNREVNFGSSTSDAVTGIYWRISDGTEPSSVTFTQNADDDLMGWWIVISGVDTSNPIHNTSGLGQTTGSSGGDFDITGHTTTVDDVLALWFMSFDGADGDPWSITASGWTNFIYGETAGGNNTDISGGWGRKNMASQGATGTVNVDPDATDGASYVQVSINPAVSDNTPDNFDFTDQPSVPLSNQRESDIVVVTGMDNGTTITIDGASAYDYRICTNDDCTTVAHAYSSSAGSIDAGEYLQLRLTSSASQSTATVATVTVGTLAVDWSVTTASCPGGSVCWDGGGGTNDWSEGANWTTGVAPLTAELVVFNGLSTKAATFNAVDTIGSLTIEAGYTGTLTLAATLTNDGAFVMNGGNLTMGSTTVNQKDDWTYTAGVVNAGTSNVIFGSSPLAVSSGAMTFNDVTLSVSGGNSLTVTGTMDVDGDLTINSIDCISTGTIAVSGNITTTDTTVCQSGAAKILIDGSGAQTLSASGTAGGLPAIEINNSGTFTIQDTIHMNDNWVFTGGTVDAGTSTVIFDGSETSVTTGTMAFNNVTVNCGGANTLTLTDTFDIDGNLTLPNAGDGFGGAGGIELAGNLDST